MILDESIITAPAETRRQPKAEMTPEICSQILDGIGAVWRLVDAADGQVLYISPGYEILWDRTCESLYQSPAAWFEAIHAGDCGRILEAASNVFRTGGYDEEFRIVRPDGSIRHVRERMVLLRDQSGRPRRLAGIIEDITTRKLLEKELIEENDRERWRLGMDLHDGICQQLVSVAFATDLLRRDLVAKSTGEAFRLAKITASLDNTISQARQLSQALCPVNLSGAGLAVALRGLAEGISESMGINCVAECSDSVFIADSAVAMHIYRIAQEAIKHAAIASPSQILVRLSGTLTAIHLNVIDNILLGEACEDHGFDLGLSVIQFRTQLAGGRMTAEFVPGLGRRLMCEFPNSPATGSNSPATSAEARL